MKKIFLNASFLLILITPLMHGAASSYDTLAPREELASSSDDNDLEQALRISRSDAFAHHELNISHTNSSHASSSHDITAGRRLPMPTPSIDTIEDILTRHEAAKQSSSSSSSSSSSISISEDNTRKRYECLASEEEQNKDSLKRPRTIETRETRLFKELLTKFIAAVEGNHIKTFLHLYRIARNFPFPPEQLQQFKNNPTFKQCIQQKITEGNEDHMHAILNEKLLDVESKEYQEIVKTFCVKLQAHDGKILTIFPKALYYYSRFFNNTLNNPLITSLIPEEEKDTPIKLDLPFQELISLYNLMTILYNAKLSYSHKGLDTEATNKAINRLMEFSSLLTMKVANIRFLPNYFDAASYLEVTQPILDALAIAAIKVIYHTHGNLDALSSLESDYAKNAIGRIFHLTNRCHTSKAKIPEAFRWENLPDTAKFGVSVQDLINWDKINPIRSCVNLSNAYVNNLEGLQNISNKDQIHSLILSCNQLTTIDPGIFESFNNLLDIALNHNQLITIGPNVFMGCSNLRTVHLHNNRITTIDDNSLAGLQRLQYLDLSNNHIQATHQSPFNTQFLASLPNNLSTLDLRKNQITRTQAKKNKPQLQLMFPHAQIKI